MAEMFDVLKPSHELTRTDLIQGLRELADFLEENGHLFEDADDVTAGRITLTQFVHKDLVYKRHDETEEEWLRRKDADEEAAAEQVRKTMAQLALQTDGTWQKDYGSHYLDLRRSFGYDAVRFELSAQRDLVCTARKVGTRIEKVRDPEALKQVPMIEKTVDEVEWDCHPILSRSDRDA